MKRRALDLRVGGATYEQIAEALGCSVRTAWRYVQIALDESAAITKEAAEKVRRIEVRRLDGQLLALWPNRADPQTAQAILKVSQRRSAILGLDAPLKIQAKGLAMTAAERAQQIAAILAAARARADSGAQAGDAEESVEDGPDESDRA